jgi:hypothetical protein
MGLVTHVWMLTMAHLRWALLQRCGLDFCIHFENDEDYLTAIESIVTNTVFGKEIVDDRRKFVAGNNRIASEGKWSNGRLFGTRHCKICSSISNRTGGE